jgi:hypothetical protein
MATLQILWILILMNTEIYAELNKENLINESKFAIVFFEHW